MPLPKLVALDLDGTLLDSAKRLTPRTHAAVRALVDRGVLVVLASGRMFRNCIEPFVAALDLTTPVIAYNGAVIIDPTQGRILSEKPIVAELCEPVIAFAAETGQTLNLYLNDTLYNQRETPWTQLYCNRVGARPVVREDLYTWARGRACTKLLLLDEPPAIEQLCRTWQERLGDQLYITISDPEYLEFMDPTATKGWALETVCDLLGVAPADAAAFGDARNDLPLIQAAGIGVAMGNGRPELQAVADVVAPPNDADGVAQVIEGWLAES